MDKNKIFLASILVILGGIFRMIPHPVNMSPIAGMALIAGMYIGRNYLAFLLPILALFASDLFLNNTINRSFFQDQSGFVIGAQYMLYTYAAYILTVLLGFYLMKKTAAHKILAGTLFSSLLFFAVTNVGVWLSGMMYPKDLGGLLACFTAAMPFFRNTLLSNAIFITSFILTIELVSRAIAKRKMATS